MSLLTILRSANDCDTRDQLGAPWLTRCVTPWRCFQQRERLHICYLTPLKLLSASYRGICPPQEESCFLLAQGLTQVRVSDSAFLHGGVRKVTPQALTISLIVTLLFFPPSSTGKLLSHRNSSHWLVKTASSLLYIDHTLPLLLFQIKINDRHKSEV